MRFRKNRPRLEPLSQRHGIAAVLGCGFWRRLAASPISERTFGEPQLFNCGFRVKTKLTRPQFKP
jgi:hypothetical protein